MAFRDVSSKPVSIHSSGSAVNKIVCAGDPAAMGFAQGASEKNRIRDASHAIAQLEPFRLQQPVWLPYRAYRWLAKRRAKSLIEKPLAQEYPAMRERLLGIAAGAGVSANTLYLFNAIEPLLSSVGGCTASPAACSAVAIRARRSATGEPIVARNFDYLPLAQPFYLLRENRPQGKLRSLEFTSAPLVGAVDGMNEAGLCITYDYAYTTDEPLSPAAPISLAISEALESCRTVAEAADSIVSRPRWGGGLLMLCDADGDLASLELSSTRSHLRRAPQGEDVLFHTNAFSDGSMKEVQIPSDAVYSVRAARALRGQRLHQSSEMRDQRFTELLHSIDVLGIDDLAAVMADHGPDGTPTADTPCVHSSYWYTTACLQFFPRSRQIRVAFDTACRARFQTFEL